ncbi:hypothetical protein ACFX2I_000561 [Malus domestica]
MWSTGKVKTLCRDRFSRKVKFILFSLNYRLSSRCPRRPDDTSLTASWKPANDSRQALSLTLTPTSVKARRVRRKDETAIQMLSSDLV